MDSNQNTLETNILTRINDRYIERSKNTTSLNKGTKKAQQKAVSPSRHKLCSNPCFPEDFTFQLGSSSSQVEDLAVIHILAPDHL